MTPRSPAYAELLARARAVAADDGAPPRDALPSEPVSGDASAGPALRYWTLDAAQRDAELMAPPVPVVAPLAYAGRVTVLSARQKMGKSTLCGDVVAALSQGRAFFPGAAPAACPVLWYGADEPLGDAVRRLAAAGAHPGRVVLSDGRPSPGELAAAIAAHGARLVVVDTLSELWRGRVDKDGDAGQVAAFVRPYVDVARATGAALLFLYHTNKGGREYRGSVALGATVDAVLTLRPARAATLGAGAPAGGAPGADDDEDDADAVDDDGRRVLVGRTRWGVVRVRLGFDGTHYTPGDAPLPLAVRALREIGAGRAASGSALARALGVRKARAGVAGGRAEGRRSRHAPRRRGAARPHALRRARGRRVRRARRRGRRQARGRVGRFPGRFRCGHRRRAGNRGGNRGAARAGNRGTGREPARNRGGTARRGGGNRPVAAGSRACPPTACGREPRPGARRARRVRWRRRRGMTAGTAPPWPDLAVPHAPTAGHSAPRNSGGNSGARPVLAPGAVLGWAVDVGAALALREPPGGAPGRGAAGVALLVPHVAGAARLLAVPASVAAALAADWRVLRALLADTHAALGWRRLPGWPASLDEPHGAALLTVATWAEGVRLVLADAGERAAWRVLAADAAARGAPRWLAAVAASEALAGPATPCPAVRARHRAAVPAAHGGRP